MRSVLVILVCWRMRAGHKIVYRLKYSVEYMQFFHSVAPVLFRLSDGFFALIIFFRQVWVRE
jgi:hypothetical protein